MPDKLIVWLMCTVLFSFLPLGFGVITGQFLSVKDFLGSSQLLLICIAFDSEALGEIFANFTGSLQGGLLIIALLNMFFLVVSSIMYSLVSRYQPNATTPSLIFPPYCLVPPIFIVGVFISFMAQLFLLQ